MKHVNTCKTRAIAIDRGKESRRFRTMGFVIGLAAILITNLANADEIYLGNMTHGGTGCPAYTASAALSPDAKQLSILFDQFVAEAGGTTGRTLDRKSCNIIVPVHVPQGLSLSIFQVDYRGYNGLPRGGSSQLEANYFFADKKGPSKSTMFVGPLDDNFYVSDKLLASAIVWTGCGQDVNLRINANMRVRTNSRGDQSLASVDSVDLSTAMIYHLQWRQCR